MGSWNKGDSEDRRRVRKVVVSVITLQSMDGRGVNRRTSSKNQKTRVLQS